MLLFSTSASLSTQGCGETSGVIVFRSLGWSSLHKLAPPKFLYHGIDARISTMKRSQKLVKTKNKVHPHGKYRRNSHTADKAVVGYWGSTGCCTALLHVGREMGETA
ncbi:hypothetical protein DM02DRAFT_34190 [Periconia macrospinosa]|uniref:Uncharacterized protein n=1 Tax=Periconia macrospinosa TaxID=97972 RepID=A0A2V1E7M8_9PLEO|nr:hypothetical protein DM02DRAFT_34190 [Periconia macrospinosa]